MHLLSVASALVCEQQEHCHLQIEVPVLEFYGCVGKFIYLSIARKNACKEQVKLNLGSNKF